MRRERGHRRILASQMFQVYGQDGGFVFRWPDYRVKWRHEKSSGEVSHVALHLTFKHMLQTPAVLPLLDVRRADAALKHWKKKKKFTYLHVSEYYARSRSRRLSLSSKVFNIKREI